MCHPQSPAHDHRSRRRRSRRYNDSSPVASVRPYGIPSGQPVALRQANDNAGTRWGFGSRQTSHVDPREPLTEFVEGDLSGLRRVPWMYRLNVDLAVTHCSSLQLRIRALSPSHELRDLRRQKPVAFRTPRAGRSRANAADLGKYTYLSGTASPGPCQRSSLSNPSYLPRALPMPSICTSRVPIGRGGREVARDRVADRGN